mgnify:CR=1 FL=1
MPHCSTLAEWTPAVDVSETEERIVIKAEVPGIEVKDIDISLSGDVLTIKGEKKSEQLSMADVPLAQIAEYAAEDADVTWQLRSALEPLLRQVPFGVPEYIETKRLLAFLEWFLPVETDLIPDNSIIREFIGGSILKDFKIWKLSSR